MRFVDYKCSDCGNITEVVIRSNNSGKVKCSRCSSTNMVRIFAPVGFKGSSVGDDSSSNSSGGSCLSGSCTTCSGCK